PPAPTDKAGRAESSCARSADPGDVIASCVPPRPVGPPPYPFELRLPTSDESRLNRFVRLTDKLYRAPHSFAHPKQRACSRDCRDEARLSRFHNRLPDLRLLTPSVYDRAFLSNPLRNCHTSQPCFIIELSPSALVCSA